MSKACHGLPMPLRKLFFATLLALLPCLGLAQQESSSTEIKPPFNLNWSTPADMLEKLLKGAKATIVQRRRMQDGRESWEVAGLVAQSGVKRTIFYFQRNELVEVELQYEKPEWDEAKYNEYMGQLRRVIEKRYGAGEQIVRRTEPEGDVLQTLVGYKWNLNNTAIELFYYCAEQTPNVYRTLSVHYKGY